MGRCVGIVMVIAMLHGTNLTEQIQKVVARHLSYIHNIVKTSLLNAFGQVDYWTMYHHRFLYRNHPNAPFLAPQFSPWTQNSCHMYARSPKRDLSQSKASPSRRQEALFFHRVLPRLPLALPLGHMPIPRRGSGKDSSAVRTLGFRSCSRLFPLVS